MKIVILGCGSSGGVPLITGHWGKCNPDIPQNRRTRCSVALSIDQELWLIDASPDLRAQCLREGITRVDGVLCTHAHFDHVGGLAELKPFSVKQKSPIPLYSNAETLQVLRQCYAYAFAAETGTPEVYAPFLQGHLLPSEMTVAGVTVKPFIQDHHYLKTLGFRFPTWAYSTDVWKLDEAAFDVLQGIDLWLVDCLDSIPRASHSHLEQTLTWIERVKPKRAVLIHMGSNLDYVELMQKLPPHVIPAFDGMILES